jgi:type I restriction enzyme S subunit
MNRNLPTGWRIRPLEQVAAIRTGVAMNKSKLKDPVRLPYLRVANVQAGRLDLREVKHIEIERHQIERFSLQIGDVLMTEGGDYDKLGRGDLWQGEIESCLHQNHVFAVRADRRQILPGFLNALSNSSHGRAYFLSCAKRSTNLASINAAQLRSFPVFVPPMVEQEKICEMLEGWERIVACAQATVANRQAQQKGLRQTLLSERASQAWPRVMLTDLAVLSTSSLSLQQADDFTFRYITLTSVTAGRIGALESFNLSQAPARARRLVREGDILFSMVRPNLQGYARIDDSHADCVASTGFAVLRPKPEVDAGYLYHALFCGDIQRQIQRHVTGSSYPSISMRDVSKLSLAFPPASIQKQITKILDGAEIELALVEKQRDILLQEKMFWTQKLVTGEFSVNTESPKFPKSH